MEALSGALRLGRGNLVLWRRRWGAGRVGDDAGGELVLGDGVGQADQGSLMTSPFRTPAWTRSGRSQFGSPLMKCLNGQAGQPEFVLPGRTGGLAPVRNFAAGRSIELMTAVSARSEPVLMLAGTPRSRRE